MSDFVALTPAAFRNDKRTSGTLRCNPPNRRCGARCIPPSWDCRLKGEGNDPHLKAAGKGSDPIAGFASLERGFSRVGKGVVKLSFSEIEGGRRALARGAAKLSPGDLQKKKELQQTVYNYGLAVGAPVTVAIFAALSHKGLKSFRGYREGPGRQIDEAVGGAFRQIARNVPFGVGSNIRSREAAGISAVQGQARAMRNLEAGGIETVTARASRSSFLQRTAASGTGGEIPAAVVTQLRKVDVTNGKPSKLSYVEWEDKSLSAFWATPRPQSSVPAWAPSGEKTSLFALEATNTLLTRSFNLTPKPQLAPATQVNDIVDGVARNLRESGEAIRTSMRQAGLNTTSPEDVRRYIRSVEVDRAVPALARERMYQTLEVATLSTNYTTQARTFYQSTLEGFDQFFQRLSTTVTDRPGIQIPQDIRSRSFWRDGTLAHADVLARRMGFDAGPITGTGTATVVKRAYHASHVMVERKRPFKTSVTLTRTEALTAASEIARNLGRPEPSNSTEAIGFLNEVLGGGSEARQDRLRGLTLVQAPAPERPAPVQAPANPPRPMRGRTEAQRLADIQRERLPDGTPRYPTPEAAQAELRRRQNRTDATLRARLDYTPPNERTGKPCGKSFVPKQRKCSKPTSRRYADRPQRPAASPRARRSYPAGYIPNRIKRSHTVSEETSKKVGSIAERAAKVAAVAGVVGVTAVGGRAAYRNRAKIAKSAVDISNRAQLVAGIKTINGLSSKQVQSALSKVPTQYQEQVKGLVGRAKLGAAAMVLKADSSELINVDTKNNLSTFRHKAGHLLTIGSVDDSLLLFRSHAETKINTGNGNEAGKYVMDFQVDLKHDQKTNASSQQSAKIVRATKAMFNEQIKQMPNNSFISVTAHKADGLGDKRRRVYEKWGFQALPGMNQDNLWAVKRDNKFSKVREEELEGLAWLLRSNRQDSATKRTDKKCGKTGIAKHKKCTKPIVQRVAEVTATTAAVGVVGFNSFKLINVARTLAPSTGKLKRPANKPASDWLDAPNSPGMHEGHRMRTYAANQKMREVPAAEMADQVRKLSGNSKVAALIERHNLKLTPKVIETIEAIDSVPAASKAELNALREQLSTAPQLEGFYLDPNYPGYGDTPRNAVYINFRRDDNAVWNPSAAKLKSNMAQYQRARAKTTETTEQIHADPTPDKIKNNMDSFMTYSTAQGDERDYLLGLHEMAHALDIGVGKRQRPSAVRNKPIDPAQFIEQAKVVTSGYGQTDLLTRADEFFAESFVLYTASPDYLKAKAPIVYDWVDTYMDQLLALNP